MASTPHYGPLSACFEGNENTLTNTITTAEIETPFPEYVIQELAEYKKLLYLYEERFEHRPDAAIRAQLSERAIKIVAEAKLDGGL